MTLLRELAHDENGATMVEYALLLAFFGLFAIAAMTLLSGALNGLLTYVAGALTGGQTSS